MVRRRCTVRFRNGAPGHERFSNDSDERRGTSRGRRASAPMAAKAPIAQSEPARQLLKAAAGGSSRHSPVMPGRGHAGQALQRPGGVSAPMSRINVRGRPGGCWCHPARAGQGSTSAWITAASLGWGGDARGQDADPPVHAVRVRDRPPAGQAEGAARRFYAHAEMSTSFTRICMHKLEKGYSVNRSRLWAWISLALEFTTRGR